MLRLLTQRPNADPLGFTLLIEPIPYKRNPIAQAMSRPTEREDFSMLHMENSLTLDS